MVRTVRALECEAVGEILLELYTSKIGFSIRWMPESGVDVKLLDPAHGVVAEDSFASGVVAAVEWLRDVAYDHYRDTAFPEASDPADPVVASP